MVHGLFLYFCAVNPNSPMFLEKVRKGAQCKADPKLPKSAKAPIHRGPHLGLLCRTRRCRKIPSRSVCWTSDEALLFQQTV
jgi:hypothetical protein